MGAVENIITDNLPIWSSAIQSKSSAGRGTSGIRNLYGVKKLRELILDLAVRGLLVPQDPNDEPASVLLEKIAAEKERLVKEGKLRKNKILKNISQEEQLSSLPIGWVLSRFGTVLDFNGGSQPPKDVFSDKMLEDYVQLIQIRDLGPKPQPVFVPKDLVTKFCTTNDIMIGRYGASVGKVFWGKDGAYNVALIRINNDLQAYTSNFLYFLMKSPLGQSLFSGISRSAQAGFSKGDIENEVLPLPPLAEQHRIVAKVDELMALCDTLEQQQEDSIQAHETLVEVLLEALSNAVDADAFQAAWGRISEHFDALFTTDHSINKLKETILQLAVMGKLVPQDPSDEPASVLLEKIAAERERLVKAGKLKKQKALSDIELDELYCDLPKSWQWIRLGNLTNYGSTNKVETNDVDDTTWVLELEDVEKETSRLKAKIRFSERNFKSSKNKFLRGDVIYGKLRPYLDKVLVADEDGVCTTEMMPVRGFADTSPEFLRLTMKSSAFKTYANNSTHGMNLPRMGTDKARLALIPLAPAPEQHRIVAKVDELMAICDQLKNSLQQAQETQILLTDAVVENAL